jgi:hypothetical protein
MPALTEERMGQARQGNVSPCVNLGKISHFPFLQKSPGDHIYSRKWWCQIIEKAHSTIHVFLNLRSANGLVAFVTDILMLTRPFSKTLKDTSPIEALLDRHTYRFNLHPGEFRKTGIYGDWAAPIRRSCRCSPVRWQEHHEKHYSELRGGRARKKQSRTLKNCSWGGRRHERRNKTRGIVEDMK